MDSNSIFILVLIIVLLLGSLLVFVVYSIFHQEIVTSNAITSLVNLNKATLSDFSNSKGQSFNIEVNYKRKQQYDEKTLEQVFASYVAAHYQTYASLYNDIKSDRSIYSAYLEQYKELRLTLGCSWQPQFLLGKKKYDSLERLIFDKKMLRPPKCCFVVKKTYTSPKKKNHYAQKATFQSDYFLKVSDKAYSVLKRRKEARKERYRINARLRYKVFVRDGFACVICGRTMSDGVQLQVDHIKPISRGGKTTLDNLRTLCRDCNLGKGCAYNPDGLN